MPTLVRRMHIGFELSPAQYRRLLGGSECAHFARHSSATSAYGRLRMAIQQEMYQSNSSALKLKSGMIFSSETGSSSHSTRSEEHTSELQSLMRISYAVFCLKTKTIQTQEPATDPTK